MSGSCARETSRTRLRCSQAKGSHGGRAAGTWSCRSSQRPEPKSGQNQEDVLDGSQSEMGGNQLSKARVRKGDSWLSGQELCAKQEGSEHLAEELGREVCQGWEVKL